MADAEYKPYDGPVVDISKPHYHRWFLSWTTYEEVDGPWATPIWMAAMRPYHNRMTARNHGFKDRPADEIMILKCDGKPNHGCPANFDPDPAVHEGK